MSNYENVDRQQQHVNKKTAAKFRAPTSSKLRRKQRKWTVLLSIGLLLPALAAVIGIVAWAISIEVSNSDRATQNQQPLSSSNQQHRKLHQNQLLLPVAQKQHHFSPFRRQQQQQQQQQQPQLTEEVSAAAQVSNVRQARTPEPEWRAQEKVRKLNEQQDEFGGAKGTSSKSENFEERNSATSTLLLTNLGQVEAIRGSSAANAALQQQTSTSTTTTTTTTTTTAAPTFAVSTEDYVPVSSSSSVKSTSSGTAVVESEKSSKQQQVNLPEQQQEEEKQFEADCEKSRHVDEDDEEDNNDDAQKMLMFMMMSPKNANHKSRFFSSAAAKTATGTAGSAGTTDQRKQLINRLPTKGQQQQQQRKQSSAAVAALAKQITSSLHHQVEDPTVAHLSGQEKRASRLLKSDAKIAFLAANGPTAAGKHRYVITAASTEQPDSDEQQQVGSGGSSEPEVATSQPLPAVPEEERSSGSDNPFVKEPEDSSAAGGSVGNLLNTSTSPPTTTTTTTPATSASKEQPKAGDDELSFELIASAISTSLNQHQLPSSGDSSASLKSAESPLDGDTSGDFAANESLVNNAADNVASEFQASSPDQVLIRRRTPGEHVAEVIDHIVERRKQHSLQEQQRGPQIVVVAPVGGDSMKARSLIKLSSSSPDDDKVASSKEQLKVNIMKTRADSLSVVNNSEKSSKSSNGSIKKDVILAKKQFAPGDIRYTGSSRSSNASKWSSSSSPLIGARLLGSGTGTDELKANVKGGSQQQQQQQQPIKYSERVEVIEDDDSSAFLMKSLTEPVKQQDQEDTTLQRRLSSHTHSSPEEVSQEENNNNNNRYNEEEDESSASSIHVSSHSGEPRSRSPRHELNPALVFERFAQQTIERRQQQQVNVPNQLASVGQNNQLKLYSAEQLIRDHVLKSKSRPKQPQPQVQVQSLQSQMSNQAAPELQQQFNSQVQQSSHEHQVKVIPTTLRPHFSSTTTTTTTAPSTSEASQQQDARQSPMQQSDSNGYLNNRQVGNSAPVFNQHQVEAQMKPADSYQALESQQQSVMYQQPSAAQPVPVPQQQQQQQQHLYQESSSYQAQAPLSAANQQQQQQQQLPMFADQEFNVPAHMAESVIQSIQRAPPSINMLNGQPTLISLSSSNQVPFQPIHQSHLEQLQQQPSSPQQALYLANQQFQNQQHLQHLQNNQQQQAFNQAAFLSRFANQHHHNQMNNQQPAAAQIQQRQVIANRNGGEPAALVVPVKKSMIHPVAQMALRHLFTSMGQQAQVQEQQQQQSGRPVLPTGAAPPQSGVAAEPQVAPPATTDTVAINHALPGEDLQAAGSRQMRSLTVDNSPAAVASEQQVAAQSQQQQLISDQEVQESYGQMPAYHYGGGGGGDHYNGNNYQSDHDKKSKGLTFHFGGGPIGGGTQLITSPMGIFKHLMLPLMPNPLVHINGKVVFGVVLEKSTKIGSPPKKKYKFWGR